MSNVLNTAIGDARNAKASRKSAHVVDGSGLRAAHGHDLLGDAGGTTAHADSETVNASGDEGSSLLSSHDVSSNDIEVGEFGLDPLDHLNLVHAVTLRRIQDDNVQTSIDQLLETELVLWAGANGSGAEELLAVGELGGKGEVLVLGQVGARDHRNEVQLRVHDGELALLRLGKNLIRLEQGNAIGSGDEVGDHDLGDGSRQVFLELDVSVGDDAQQLGAELAVLCRMFKLAQSLVRGDATEKQWEIEAEIIVKVVPMTVVYTVERKLYIKSV